MSDFGSLLTRSEHQLRRELQFAAEFFCAR